MIKCSIATVWYISGKDLKDSMKSSFLLLISSVFPVKLMSKKQKTGVTAQVNRGRAVDVMYLNFCKAFDTDPHNFLLSKFERYRFDE